MTVLVTLEHHKLERRRHRRPARRRRRRVERPTSSPGDELTVARPDQGRADPVGERRRRRARALGRARLSASFAALMNEKAAAARAARHALRPARRARRAGRVSSAADVTKLARIVMRIRVRPRRPSPSRRRRSPAGGRCTRGTTCLTQFPQTIGVKTGHTEQRRLVPGRSRARPRRDRLRDAARQPDALASGTTTSSRCSSGGSRSSASCRPCSRAAPTRPVACRYGKAPLELVAAKPLLAVARLGRPLDRDGRRRDAASRCPCARARSSAASRSGREPALWGRATSSLPARLTSRVSADD